MKSKLLVAVLFLLCVRIFSDSIHIAPIVCFDETGKKIELNINPNESLYDLLEKYYFNGLIVFNAASEKKTGSVTSILEAERLCNISNCDYVIYGYFQRNENSWYGNLRLYSKTQKKIVKDFFASDSIENYERMLRIFEDHIVDYCKELLGISDEDIITNKTRSCEIRIPASLFYWSPITEKWNDVYTGVIGVKAGVEIFPPINNYVFHSMCMNYSAQLRLSYAYGFGVQDNYPLNYHEIKIETPVIVHLHFDKYNSIYLGTGVSNEFQLMQIQEHYKDEELYYQNMFGYFGITGYEFTLNELLSIYSEVQFESHFSDDKYLAIKPSLGVVFRINKGK